MNKPFKYSLSSLIPGKGVCLETKEGNFICSVASTPHPFIVGPRTKPFVSISTSTKSNNYLPLVIWILQWNTSKTELTFFLPFLTLFVSLVAMFLFFCFLFSLSFSLRTKLLK